MKSKKYWAVCYGHVCRWSEADTASLAAKDAFGIINPERMTVRQFPKNPRYFALYKRKIFLDELFQRHKEKTGSIIK